MSGKYFKENVKYYVGRFVFGRDDPPGWFVKLLKERYLIVIVENAHEAAESGWEKANMELSVYELDPTICEDLYWVGGIPNDMGKLKKVAHVGGVIERYFFYHEDGTEPVIERFDVDAFRLGHEDIPDWFKSHIGARNLLVMEKFDEKSGDIIIEGIKNDVGEIVARKGDWVIRNSKSTLRNSVSYMTDEKFRSEFKKCEE